ncbi:hypothetical protein ACFQH6_03490 [Halobacteriaceae archaeon GCM10025711]
MQSNIPKQVRVRTDPEEGYGHRYDAIETAKDVFDVGNKTDAIVTACDHADQDRRAKIEALEYLARRANPELVAGVVERLSTSWMPIEVRIAISDESGVRTIDPEISVNMESN